MEDRNKTVAELISDLQNQLNRANNGIEVLLKENKELKDNNDIQFRNLHRLRQDINEYAKDLDKEKKKHQRATEKITQLKEESNALYDMIDYLEDELITEKVNNINRNKLIVGLKKNKEDGSYIETYFKEDGLHICGSNYILHKRLNEHYHEAKSNNKNGGKHAKN